jgi:DNA-binding beta-propeller fold protein YncE
MDPDDGAPEQGAFEPTVRRLDSSLTGALEQAKEDSIMKLRFAMVLGTIAVMILCNRATAQLAVSANDGKQPLLFESPKSHTPDNVAVIDLNVSPPKVIGTVEVPTSMIGPPVAVAVAHNNKFAAVSNAKKFDPADPTKFVLDNTVSVIDLEDPRHPKVIQTLDGGEGVTGICFDRKDSLVLVAATGGAITAFSVKGKTLTLADRIQLDPKDQPVDVAISPDGKTALVTQRSSPNVVRLEIEGTKLKNSGVAIPTGYDTYGVVFSPDGKFAYNTNLGGRLASGDVAASPPRGPRVGTVTVIDLASNKVANTIDVGNTPEHLTLSHDGKYLALTIGNGSSSRPGTPSYNPDGLLKVYSVSGANLSEVTEAKTGGWGQGATWNKDHSLLLLQSGIEKDIEVFRFDGKSLTRESADLRFDSRPGSIATATTR